MQRYEKIRMIGKGGMGEVYLVYDPLCSRKVALKCIRKDLSQNPILKQRFLREAKIAADLVHPGVVSVFSICSDQDPVYYTMPYIEGYTLKNLFKSVWQKETLSKELAEKTSIQAFLSIFHKICSTIEYVHAKGILHRDLKPDNILLGIFNQVVILDWGAAVALSENTVEEDVDSYPRVRAFASMTVPGKIVGTPDYMPPERLKGGLASERTEVYALGVILYQMLTLSFPFRRKKGKRIEGIPILLPEEVAPYRNIPGALSQVVMRALAEDPSQRYASVSELKQDIDQHLQGEPKWSSITTLSLNHADNWKWREWILLSKYFPMLEVSPASWYGLFISNVESCSDVRLEYSVSRTVLEEGFGVLLTPSREVETGAFHRGFGFWLHIRDNILSVSLVRNGLEMQRTEHVLSAATRYIIALEKYAYRLSLIVEERELLTHMDYVPSRGGRVGIITRDITGISEHIRMLESGGALKVSCLEIPDAFLCEQLYDQAEVFYQRICKSFPDRKEGEEAQFRLGITLLKKAEIAGDRQAYFRAFDAFSVLHCSSLAPLEYLGKALVYQKLGEYEEEIKSLLLALRRYSQHPDIERLKDYVVYRFRETFHRQYPEFLLFLWLVLQCSPESILPKEEEKVLAVLQDKINNSLFCFLDMASLDFRSSKMELLLSYWSGFSPALPGLFQRALDLNDYRGIADIFYVAADLHDFDFLTTYEEKFRCYLSDKVIPASVLEISSETIFTFISCLQAVVRGAGEQALKEAETLPFVLRVYVFDIFAKFFLCEGVGDTFYQTLLSLSHSAPTKVRDEYLIPYQIQACLWLKDAEKARDLLQTYPEGCWLNDKHPIFFLFGCWLVLSEKDPILAQAHFAGCRDDEISVHGLLAAMLNRGASLEKRISFLERERLQQQQRLFEYCGRD